MTRMHNTGLMDQIAARKKQLGMSYAALATRSGVSEPTLKRMLSQDEAESHSPRLDRLAAVMEALGMSLMAGPALPVDEFRFREADAKARRLVRLVQGTSALEEQAVDSDVFERMVEDARRELLDGSSRRLWTS